MTNSNIIRLGFILLFATTFMLIGWLAPVMYASYAPASQIIVVHEFDASNTTTGSTHHFICFDRTVKKPATAEVFTELYLVNGNHSMRTEVESNTIDRYFQGGRTEVVTPLDLPKMTEPGRYKYLMIVKMELADGRVTRTFTFESKPFRISRGQALDRERPEC